MTDWQLVENPADGPVDDNDCRIDMLGTFTLPEVWKSNAIKHETNRGATLHIIQRGENGMQERIYERSPRNLRARARSFGWIVTRLA